VAFGTPSPKAQSNRRASPVPGNGRERYLDEKSSQMNSGLDAIYDRIEINLIPDLFVLSLVLEHAQSRFITLECAYSPERSDLLTEAVRQLLLFLIFPKQEVSYF
jgi:hypothetical protein